MPALKGWLVSTVCCEVVDVVVSVVLVVSAAAYVVTANAVMTAPTVQSIMRVTARVLLFMLHLLNNFQDVESFIKQFFKIKPRKAQIYTQIYTELKNEKMKKGFRLGSLDKVVFKRGPVKIKPALCQLVCLLFRYV